MLKLILTTLKCWLLHVILVRRNLKKKRMLLHVALCGVVLSYFHLWIFSCGPWPAFLSMGCLEWGWVPPLALEAFFASNPLTVFLSSPLWLLLIKSLLSFKKKQKERRRRRRESTISFRGWMDPSLSLIGFITLGNSWI